MNTPGQLQNALEKQATEGQADKIGIPAKSDLAPEPLKQFEPGSNRTGFRIDQVIDKKAQEHSSNVIHSKPDPAPQ